MRGFVLHTQLVKEEDLVVTILTKNRVVRLYRFYGARHSVINVGYLIDFEIEQTMVNIDRLRNVMQIGYPFLLDTQKMLIWQNFIEMMYKHLFDVEEIDGFYYYLLEEITQNFQNPKQTLISSYIKLLNFEGRLSEFECFLCDKPLKYSVNLARGYLCACENCIPKKGFEIEKIKFLFENEKTTFLNNQEIESLYKTLSLGI